MQKFTRYFAIFGIAALFLLAVLLLSAAGLLLFAPELLLTGLYYGLILICTLGAAWIVISLVRCALRKENMI